MAHALWGRKKNDCGHLSLSPEMDPLPLLASFAFLSFALWSVAFSSFGLPLSSRLTFLLSRTLAFRLAFRLTLGLALLLTFGAPFRSCIVTPFLMPVRSTILVSFPASFRLMMISAGTATALSSVVQRVNDHAVALSQHHSSSLASRGAVLSLVLPTV